MSRFNPGSAFLIFHLRVGTRLALRILAPVLAVVFALYFLFKPEFFVFLAGVLFRESGLLILAIISATVMFFISRAASFRICSGLDGWIRHLPASASLHRRLAALAVFLAQIPVLGLLAIFAVMALWPDKSKIVRAVLELTIVGLAAAYGTIYLRKTWTASARKTPKNRVFRRTLSLPTVINWRAVGWKISFAYLLSFLPLVLTKLFVINNGWQGQTLSAAVRCGGLLSLTVFLAFEANMLAAKRPPWPWARTLPSSALRRIISDSIFLAAHASLLLLPVVLIDLRAFLPVAACLPFAAVRSARAIRQSPELRLGAAGKILLEGFLEASLVALLPWAALAFLLGLPPALINAARAEQKQKVGRWLELHHLAAGDSLSWSRE
jgi:hypothetical protein